MKGKAIIPLVLGLCVGVVAVKLLVDTMKRAQAANAARNTVTIVRAKQDIDAYSMITKEMVETVETSDGRLIPQAERLTSLDAVVGRVTSKGVPQTSPVLASMLAPEGTPAGMVGRIPPGFRAVSVEIDEVTGVAYQLKPNDWVDVIVVMDVESAGSGRRNKETVAEVILQHVQIAAIGQATTGKPGEGASKVKAAKSATLLVSEEDVPKLHLAATRGKITLAMRGDDTNIVENPPSAHSRDLGGSLRQLQEAAAAAMAQAQAPAQPPARPTSEPARVAANVQQPEPPYAVTVYLGSPYKSLYPPSVQRITFENANSGNILDISDGPISRGAALMSGRGRSRPSDLMNTPQTPPQGDFTPPDEVDAVTGQNSAKGNG